MWYIKNIYYFVKHIYLEKGKKKRSKDKEKEMNVRKKGL
jgi:hypothetical protein